METYIAVTILVVLLSLMFYNQHRKREKIRKSLEESLEDETIYVEGVGNVKFDELDEMAKGDSEEGVKYQKDTMFREDLMKFEGEFLIPGLALNEERRLSIDDAFLYVLELFGEDILKKPVLTPHDPVFPATLESSQQIISLAHTIAKIMEIDPNDLELGFFEGAQPVDPATVDTSSKNNFAAGLYYGKNEEGKYVVTFADNIYQDTDRAIATIAHEFAHIKLLGEKQMEENSEELTDMLPLFYGFGLFNSNTVFQFSRDMESWSTHTLGYLSQMDWSYLFALYLYSRGEKDPEWMNYMNKTVAKECKMASAFITTHPEKVLQSKT